MVKVIELIDAVFTYNEKAQVIGAGKFSDKTEFHFHTDGGDLNMGDSYNVTQGIAGKNVSVNTANFYQSQWEEIQSRIDIEKLIEELKLLKENLVKQAKTPQHYSAIAEVAKAEEAAQKKDGPKVLEFLKNAGKWALDAATSIGTTIAADVIKKSMGI